MERKEDGLGTRPIWKLVLGLAIPTMLAQFVNVLYSIVDRIYIGNMEGVGAEALAGVGICGPIVTLLSSFAALVGLGGAPLLAIRMGERNREAAQKILNNSFLLLVIISAVLTGIVFLLKERMLYWFGASERLFPYAEAYLSWYAAGTLFAILATGLNSFIVCQGFGKTAMVTVLIGAVFNIALDPVFIFVLDMGVKGAAIATVLSQAASAAFTLVFLFGRHTFVRIRPGGYSLGIMRRILVLGLSPFFIIATDSVIILALNGVLQAYGGAESGDNLVATATIVLSFMQIITMPMGGITGGTQPILSYNYGARNSVRVKRGVKCILIVCLVFTSIMFVAARFAAPMFVGIFTKDAEIASLSVQGIHIFTIAIIPLSFQYVFVDALTALGIAPVAITLSLFRKMVVMLVLIFVLPAWFGAFSAFWAEPIADLVSSLTSSTVFLLFINRILKRREELQPAVPSIEQQTTA